MMDKVFILLGAGFSFSITNGKQVLARDFSSSIREDLLELVNLYNKEIGQNQLEWFINNIKDKNFNFEHFCEILWFLGELNRDNYPSGITKEFINRLYDLIHTKLFISYSEPELHIDRSKRFVDMIKHLLSKNYEVHIFDLNFDTVLEDCLKIGDIDFEDFFGGTASFHSNDYPTCNITARYYSGREKSSKKVFTYKLHGAFNIVSIDDGLRHKHTGFNLIPNTSNSYSSLRFGFYKIQLEDFMVGDLKKSFIEGISKLSFIDKFKTQSSLWTSNYIKLKLKSLDQSYPSFCFDSYKKVLRSSKVRFILGYGSMDPDINRLLYDRCRHEALIGTKPCKTYVEIDENIELNLNIANSNHDIELEQYLDRFQ